MFALIKRFLVRLLLLPLLPLLAWGSATHPYINKRALELALAESAAGNKKVNRDIVATLARNKDAYVFGGNSADAISAYHILSGGVAIYDYMHNYYPDNASGVPFFGYKLIDEWYRSADGQRDATYPEEDLAIACGWLSHQLADWYAHHAPIDREGYLSELEPNERTVFSGYSNAHRVLGTDYYPEILDSYNTVDHALIEHFHDMLLLDTYGRGFLRENRADLFKTRFVHGRMVNLLSQTSEQFEGLASRISPETVTLLKVDFNTVIRGVQVLHEIIVHQHPHLISTIRNSIDPAVTGRPDYIKRSVRRVFDRLFCCSREDIAELADRVTKSASQDCVMEFREAARAGTLLFKPVGNLTRLIDPDRIGALLMDPDAFNLRFFWGLLDVRASILRSIMQGWGSAKLNELFGKDPQLGPLIAFVAELTQGKAHDFSEPLTRFRTKLSPLVQLLDAGGSCTPETDRTKYTGLQIRVKVVPAVEPHSGRYDFKRLDPDSLRFFVDGYDVEAKPATFDLDRTCIGKKLLLTCAFKKELLPGAHYLYVKIGDRSKAPAGTLWHEFRTKTR